MPLAFALTRRGARTLLLTDTQDEDGGDSVREHDVVRVRA